MKLLAGWATDVGRVREGNEDAVRVDERLHLFAVADGMGGHRAGEAFGVHPVRTTTMRGCIEGPDGTQLLAPPLVAALETVLRLVGSGPISAGAGGRVRPADRGHLRLGERSRTGAAPDVGAGLGGGRGGGPAGQPARQSARRLAPENVGIEIARQVATRIIE